MANKYTSIVQMVLVTLLVAFTIWLFTQIQPVGDAVKCIVDGIDELAAMPPTTEAGATANEMGNAIPDGVMNALKQAAPVVTALAVTPAALIALFSCCLAVLTMRSKAGSGTCCVQCLMILFTKLCFVGIVLYLVIGVVGILSTSARGEDARTELTNTCDQFGPQFQQELDSASAMVAILSQGDSEYDKEVREMNAAIQTIEISTGMCQCMVNVFEDLGKFTAPGFACAAMCIFLFFINCCQCCMLCCCKKKAAGQGVEMKKQGFSDAPTASSETV